MKRLVAIAAAAGVGLSGAAITVSAQAETAQAAGTIAWAKCPADQAYLDKAECGQLSVPLDYRHPNGKKISIAVSRLKHTDTKHYKGVLLANPGGPGGSGLYLAGGLASWFTGVGHPEVPAQYDIIGFDPRGVGLSQPALTCDPHYSDPIRPDYVPHSAKDEEKWKARSKAYAQACAKKFGWLLPHLRTTDAARDIDSIRAALGQSKISYYGFSYGTYLGATYGTLFPKRVKRMVLDGNVDVREVWYDAQLSQDKAFERNIKLFFGWVAKYDSHYHLGKKEADVEKKYYSIRSAAFSKPIGGKLGGDELDDTVLNAGYSVGWYEPVADVLSAWADKGDADPLVSLYTDYIQTPDDNGFAVYNAVQAADAKWPRSWSTWHKDAVKLYDKEGIRYNTWPNVWFNAPIAYWPFQGGPALKIKAKGMSTALLVQSTLDAATPYPGGVEMHKLLPSRLVAEIGGKTHANTLNGNACLDDKVAAYLSDGTLPKNKPGSGPDATCKALPDPVPAGAAAMATRSIAPKVPARPLIGRP
ncbi:alpha/beta hydrolase [Actinoallomurus rhizosphaericola]|uniref:alpha/beta hydrolase n=1 Tax=Actinoallomurus rhizosphaericola TaxID=2952536 RepID=UPI0020907DDA|nr:alpha/beta hydrolase [Actinoallomurus rhizosphaericola]MCO5992193.1 alpha/beta hydrolase [Actinoallomurus rhizosphaericola]